MADLQSSQQLSAGRSEKDWKKFYKNGLPKEIIVIEDSPSPQIPNSVESEPITQRPIPSNGSDSRQPAKKRKREDVYDSLYHDEAKRRGNEADGCDILNYHPPPKPPIKPSEVEVKVFRDVEFS